MRNSCSLFASGTWSSIYGPSGKIFMSTYGAGSRLNQGRVKLRYIARGFSTVSHSNSSHPLIRLPKTSVRWLVVMMITPFALSTCAMRS